MSSYWKPLLVAGVLAGAGLGVGYWLGEVKLDRQALAFTREKSSLENGIAAERRQWDAERLRAGEQHRQSLNAALLLEQQWRQKADDAAQRLAASQAAAKKQRQQLEKKLSEAIEKDGSHYTGIGPDGLRLYSAALGYAPGETGNAGGHRVPETPGVTAGSAANASRPGLGPGPLIHHAGEYGQWCLQMRAQLDELQRFYGVPEWTH
ncbi:hypothetical protein EHW64_13675 [Erwinia psidii]|uniref:hypothetical protein n=1 Tax=Erwinia psidii TaxID=69224 RepID=UPI00226BBB50|nr:hypothetical protein [Erwinia psidii]MCX8962152.1 hypothetical protein [Erwinia psidii]